MDYYSEAIREGLKPKFATGTATTAAATIDLAPGSKAIILFNTSTKKILLYSYDGSVYFTLPGRARLNEQVDIPKLYVKTNAGTCNYDLKAALKQ